MSAGGLHGHALLEGGRLLLLRGALPAPWGAPEREGALHTSLGRIALRFAGFSPDAAAAGGVSFHAAAPLPALPALELRAVELAGLDGHLALAAPEAPEVALSRLRRALAAAGTARAVLLPLLPRRGFEGVDTLGRLLPHAVQAGADRALRTGEAGLLVLGFLADPGGRVAAIRLCTAEGEAELNAASWLNLPRPDLRDAVAPLLGPGREDCGFAAFAPLAAAPGTVPWLEVELRDGTLGQRLVPVQEGAGLATIRTVLSLPRPPPSRLAAVMEHTVGPAVEGLNAARLRVPRRVAEMSFGEPPGAPRVSVVVPLHGRVDFLEWQLGLFSARPDPAVEWIYVLDDPRRREETEHLALAAAARFAVPFRLLALEENQGFAAACNEGARRARGEFLCLLNSDVFPLPGEGMSAFAPLCAHLARDASLGVAAPLLLFEDGTVQHQGMRFEAVRGLPPWPFPIHVGKGHPPPRDAAPLRPAAVTGACMVLRRADWEALGGLDEGFVIGDFEDSDLCLRLRARGLGALVDPALRLFHLERQSQEEGAAWRFGATLFNAWRHARRWGAAP